MFIDHHTKMVHPEWLAVLDLRVPTIHKNKDLFKERDLDSALRLKKMTSVLTLREWLITET